MSDERARLTAIVGQSDEDTPRLTYADWLDENDQPDRAEFIRSQIERANLARSVRVEGCTGFEPPTDWLGDISL